MSALDRFAHIAAATDAVRRPRRAVWRRYRDPLTGLSFDAPFEMAPETDSPADTLVMGRMTLPYVFDVSYMASLGLRDTQPESLARGMATQWMVDYDLTAGPALRRVRRPGVDEAWSVYAEIEDAAGTIAYEWLTLAKGGQIGCVGISCWTAERLGRTALVRTSESISGH